MFVSYILRSEHDNILPLTQSKFDDVARAKLHEPLCLNLLVVEQGTIAALQVDDVRPDLCLSVAEFVHLQGVPKLYDSVLFAATGMLDRYIRDSNFSADKPAATRLQDHRLEYRGVFKDVQTPILTGMRLSRIRRLVVFQYDIGPRHCVSLASQQSGWLEIRFLLFWSSGNLAGAIVQFRLTLERAI